MFKNGDFIRMKDLETLKTHVVFKVIRYKVYENLFEENVAELLALSTGQKVEVHAFQLHAYFELIPNELYDLAEMLHS